MADAEPLDAGRDGADYRLAAAGREAAEDERLDLLEQIYDPVSRERRALVQPGWRCLEVGAGRGSMAVWLAEQVGPTGQVVATDLDTRYLSRLGIPNLEVVRHDILDDPLDALEPGSFDLVCSRLMLFHLQGRQEQAIRQMAACLRPGGWLVDEDASWGTAGMPVDPSHPQYDAYERVWRDGDWWATRGYDKEFGQKLPALFERAGLEDIRCEVSSEVVQGARRGRAGGSRRSRSSTSRAAATTESRRDVAVMTTALGRPDGLAAPRAAARVLGPEARRLTHTSCTPAWPPDPRRGPGRTRRRPTAACPCPDASAAWRRARSRRSSAGASPRSR